MFLKALLLHVGSLVSQDCSLPQREKQTKRGEKQESRSPPFPTTDNELAVFYCTEGVAHPSSMATTLPDTLHSLVERRELVPSLSLVARSPLLLD